MFIFFSLCLFVLLYFLLKEYHKWKFKSSMLLAQQYVYNLHQKEGIQRILNSLHFFTPEYHCKAVILEQSGWLYADTTNCRFCFIKEDLTYLLFSASDLISYSLKEETQVIASDTASTLQNIPPAEYVKKLSLFLEVQSLPSAISLEFIDKPLEKTSYEYTEGVASAYRWKQLLQHMQYDENKNK